MKNLYRLIAILALVGLLAGCAPAPAAATATTAPTLTPVLTPPTFDQLIPIAKAFINEITANNFLGAYARFDPGYKRSYSLVQLQTTWQQVLGMGGNFLQQSGSKTSFVQGKPVVIITCDFDNGSLDMVFTFNNNSLIAGLYFTQMWTKAPAPSTF